jgi:hypothetical protein
VLNGYDHAAFVAQLAAANLPNLHTTFNWKTANPNAVAPTGTQIQNAVKNYRYYLSGLSDHTGLYTSLVNDTYGKYINPGLNNGAGINGAGIIAAGASALPNRGALGMLKEFDSTDGNGARSSLEYAYDGYRPHQTNQLVLIIGGYWQKGSATADNAVARMKIGNADLWYKMTNAYHDYAKGKYQGTRDMAWGNGHGMGYVRSLWDDVLLPYHESVTPPDPDQDTDGDGTPDGVEIRLGLDPADGSSRFSAVLTGGALQWQGQVGLTFIVQRSIRRDVIAWETVATLPGAAGTIRYTDPSPPAEGALYRVGLRP